MKTNFNSWWPWCLWRNRSSPCFITN